MYIVHQFFIIKGSISDYIFDHFRWQNTGCLYMVGNKVNGTSWQAGSSTMKFTVRMLFG